MARTSSLPPTVTYLPVTCQCAFRSIQGHLAKTRFQRVLIDIIGAGGGHRTHTPLAGPRILSPVRLPVPPPRRRESVPIVSTICADGGFASAFAVRRLSPRFVPVASLNANLGSAPAMRGAKPKLLHTRGVQLVGVATNSHVSGIPAASFPATSPKAHCVRHATGERKTQSAAPTSIGS